MPGVYEDRGIIKRIYLKNFITYTETIFTPGRNLNMIIGPNGNGKSTIIAGIALGLGAKPNILGKNITEISQFVKRGADEATIEIEIADTPHKSVKITRIITIKNRTTWMINGNKVPEAKIHELAKEYSIQIENLCQFLPQEKVSAFSELTPHDLLLSTELSVGDPKLHEYHMKLKEHQKEMQNLASELDQTKTVLDSHKQKYQELEATVSHLRERKAIKKKIDKLHQKKAWMLYDNARQVTVESKKKSDALKTEVQSLEADLKPITNQINRKALLAEESRQAAETANREIERRAGELARKVEKIENLHMNVKNIRKDTKKDIEQETNCDKTIKIAEAKVNMLENDMQVITDEIGSRESVNQQILVINNRLKNQRLLVDDLNNKMAFYNEKLNNINRHITSINDDVRYLSDVDSKRLGILQRFSPDAYEGVVWLRQNRDKFRCIVHEPMFMNIETDQRYSKYFEHIIAHQDLLAFVCEDKEDMGTLLRFLRDQKNLTINAVYSNPSAQCNTQPIIPIDNIRRYGFFSYAINFIKGPETILKYIVHNYKIHNIPFGTEEIEENIENIPEHFSRYFSPNNVYAVTKSRYTGDKSVKIVPLKNQATLLAISVDTNKITQYENELTRFGNERDGYKVKLKETEDVFQKANRDLDKHRHEISKINELKKHCKQLDIITEQIKKAKIDLEKMQKDRKSVEQIMEEEKNAIANVMNKQIKLYQECTVLHKRVVDITTESKTSLMKWKLAKHELRTITESSKNLKEKLEEKQKYWRSMADRLKPMAAESQRLYQVALEKTDNVSPSDRKFDKYQKAFATLPHDLRAIDDEIESASARLYCMMENENADELIRDYVKTKENIDKLTTLIEQNNEKLHVLTNRIVETYNLWYPMVSQLTSIINTNFSAAFESLGCVGEVALHRDDPMDFDKYELKISIKFRNEDDLQEFTRFRQSGGERAVTTAIYMLSLQEMCRVPFRCVDEINQGMDAIYERKIIDLLMHLTAKNNGSQYFILTPKLLPNLRYTEYVKVHVIYSGPEIAVGNRFNMKEYIRKISDKN